MQAFEKLKTLFESIGLPHAADTQKQAAGSVDRAAFGHSQGSFSQAQDKRIARERQLFAALAQTIEGENAKPYKDSGGWNLGMGYRLATQIALKGESGVCEELRGIGLSDKEVKTIVWGKEQEKQAVELTKEQTSRLFHAIAPEYEQLAANIYGKEHWTKLAPNKKAVLSYLAYNTGNLGDFKKLIKASKENNQAEAAKNAMPVANKKALTRAGAFLAAMWAGENEFAEKKEKPQLIDRNPKEARKEILKKISSTEHGHRGLEPKKGKKGISGHGEKTDGASHKDGRAEHKACEGHGAEKRGREMRHSDRTSAVDKDLEEKLKKRRRLGEQQPRMHGHSGSDGHRWH